MLCAPRPCCPQLTLASLFFTLLIVDFMFLNTGFKYDPDYANWSRQTTAAYYG